MDDCKSFEYSTANINLWKVWKKSSRYTLWGYRIFCHNPVKHNADQLSHSGCGCVDGRAVFCEVETKAQYQRLQEKRR